TDMGYLNLQRKWRKQLASVIDCPLIQIETESVVPVEAAMNKEAYSAASLRPKINKLLKDFLIPPACKKVKIQSVKLFNGCGIQINDIDKYLKTLGFEFDPLPVNNFIGGTSQAKSKLRRFIKSKIADYDQMRNDPGADATSNLSPYLHFGQISPLYIALEVLKSNCNSSDAFLEQLIVRRELAMNFTHYNSHYDNHKSLPAWARQTLDKHQSDKRQYCYSIKTFEQAKTHDPYWNAAQKQMILTGKMAGYMRMYWGKKILEWSDDWKKAYKTAIYLNDKYELDGRDPNGYAGVAWCFGKHDRPWSSRNIFGNIRYMNDSGLKRKFKADSYVQLVDDIQKRCKY
ncbi:MAG: deoxyribodipyrimidine photolyase, partial [Phycisphaerae bacterium]|nr:deoxyribodipyrimidine photolyase [Phycisphaerae bacterium]